MTTLSLFSRGQKYMYTFMRNLLNFFYLVIYISLEIRLFNFYIVQLVSSEFSTNQRASNWHVYTQNNSVIDWSSKWVNQQKLMNLILSRSDTVWALTKRHVGSGNEIGATPGAHGSE